MKKRLFILAIIFCFCIIPKNCFAQVETGVLEPDKMYLFNTATSGSAPLGLGNAYIADTAFFGYTFTGNQTRFAVMFDYTSNLKINTYYNFSFSVYLNGTSSSLKPNSGSTPVPTRNITSVSCNNVVLSNSSFHVYISDFNSVASGTIAISRITYSTNNDVASAIDKQTQQQHEDAEKQLEEQKKQTETIKDSDTSGASDEANSFFGDFESDDFGLSDVITMPLEFIKGLSSSKCSSLNLPLPIVKQNATLPCMTSIYKEYFGSFLTIYQVITDGLIAYWCCINIFRLVQGFKNPDNDEIEVMEL